MQLGRARLGAEARRPSIGGTAHPNPAEPATPTRAEEPTPGEGIVVQADAAAAGEVVAAGPEDSTDHTGLRSPMRRFSLNQTLFYYPAVAWAEPPRLRALFDPFAAELR